MVIGGSVDGSTVRGTPSSSSVVSAKTDPRAGVPATTTATPRTSTATTASPARAAPRTAPAPAVLPTTSAATNRRSSSAAERGSGSTRSSRGRTAQTTTSPAIRPTLVPNSFVCGATNSVLAAATSSPNTTRPTRPAGTVLGSV